MRWGAQQHGGQIFVSARFTTSSGGVYTFESGGGGGITLLDGDWSSFGLANDQGLDTLSAETYGGSSVSGATWITNNTDMTYTTAPTPDGIYNNSNNFNIYTAYSTGENMFTQDWSGTITAAGDLAGNTGRYLGVAMGMHDTTPDGKYAFAGFETYDLQAHVYVNATVGGARSSTAASPSLSVAGSVTFTVSWNATTRVIECTDGTNTASGTLTADDVSELGDAARGTLWGFNARRGDWDTANNVSSTSFSTS